MSLPEALPTTVIDTKQLCRSLHAEALQATVSEGLAQGPYIAARAGFEPKTLLSKGVVSTNAPPCPHIFVHNTFLYSGIRPKAETRSLKYEQFPCPI